MTRHTASIHLVLMALLIMVSFSSCHWGGEEKQIIVMWETDESDLVFQRWSELLEEELDRQGINANVHYQYNRLGLTQERFEVAKLRTLVRQLEAEGKGADLILAHGNYTEWLLCKSADSLVRSVPAVCFGLRSEKFLPRQEKILERLHLTERPRVRMFDTLCLKENLDLADYIQNLPGMIVTKRHYTHVTQTHRFISLLDRTSSWLDTLAVKSLDAQFAPLGRSRYYNNIMNDVIGDTLNLENDRGKIVYSVYSLSNPETNVRIKYGHNINTTWAFYPQLNPNFFIQVKHDHMTRMLTEGANFLPYYTMVSEDFLVNDSCVGGYFSPAEEIIADAVSAGKRLLNGEKIASIGNHYHAKSMHINYDILRSRGIGLDKMPKEAELHNVTLRDRNPLLANTLQTILSVVAIVLIVTVLVYSGQELKVMHRNREALRNQALRQIQNRKLLQLIFDACNVINWNENQEEADSLIARIKTDDLSRSRMEQFLSKQSFGTHSMQFRGSIDNGPVSWYEFRMFVDAGNRGNVGRSGFIMNIDKQKELEAMSVETHRLIANTQTREGFISSMNHEIRTPLHSIVGFAVEIAEHGDLLSTDEIDMFGSIIEQNATSLRKLINDILTMTLIAHSNFAINCRQCKMSEVFDPHSWQDAQKVMKWRRNILTIETPDTDAVVNVEPKILASVIDNLLLNATNFSDEGSRITVGWRLMDDSKDSGVEVYVKDEGKGIDPRYHELIFQRFFKIDSFHPGCGLGLAICKRFVEHMGGTITVESALGKGSRFGVKMQRC